MVVNGFFVLLLLSGLFSDCHGCFTSNRVKNITVRTDSTFYQGCKCEDPGTAVNLKWLDPHGQIVGPGTESNIYSRWTDPKTNSLFISNIAKSISGSYKCVTLRDGKEYTLTYNVEAYDPPYFVDTKDVQYATYDRDSLIRCEAKGDSDLSITWHKEGDEVIEITDGEKYKIKPEGLSIIGVTDDDAGVYRCTALDIESFEMIDKAITVQVISLPSIVELVATPDKNVVLGDKLTIECLVSGVPQPDYTWKKVIKDSQKSNITYEQIGNKITFESITREDQGAYECIATNNAGSTSMAINIEVLLPPIITEFNNLTVVEGSPAQVTCRASGNPLPNTTIDFSDADSHSVLYYINKTSATDVDINMAIISVNRTDTGIYTCNAINEVNVASSDMYLNVLYAPQFSEDFERVWAWDQYINISCNHQSNPPSDITWSYRLADEKFSFVEDVKINAIMKDKLHNDPLVIDYVALYGIFECTAKNRLGEARKTILVQKGFVPPVINDIKIQNLTSNSITFTIDGPNNVIGPDVIGYKSEYDESENYNITDIHQNRTWSIDRPYRLDRLKPNTSYYIKFAAINLVGDGQWSEMLSFATLEKSTPDEPIFEENIQQLVESNKVLKWKTVDNGEAVDFYAIRYCPISNDLIDYDKCEEEKLNATDEFDLINMESNTTYQFELVAQNLYGNSSAATIIITTPAEDEPVLPASAIIVIGVVVVFICILLLDLLLLVWRKQGIIASCCYKKKDKREVSINSRDKKGLLKHKSETTDSDRQNGHREYEYNKTTGVITGKHSAV